MRSWCMLSCGVVWLLLSLVQVASAQQSVVIYRCTDARGVVTLQNDVACPKGTQQEKRVVETSANAAPFPVPLPSPPSTMPAATTVAAPAVPSQSATTANNGQPSFTPVLPLPTPQKPPAERLPPPPLYQCNTAERDSYLSDTADPKPRCVRMDTVGIDGTQQLGAGDACSMVYDQCQRVPDGAACAAWRKRVNEAQSAWTFGRADSIAALKAEYERIARVVAETTCNQ